MARVIFLLNSLGKSYLSFNRGEDFFRNQPKGNMSFCHHLVYVVCHPFTFHILIVSSENPQPNELKLGRTNLWNILYDDYSVVAHLSFCFEET
jgi:hypothetical protein